MTPQINYHTQFYFDDNLIYYLNLEKHKRYTINFIIECIIKKCVYIDNYYKIDNSLKLIIINKIKEFNPADIYIVSTLIELIDYWNNGISKSALKNIIKKLIKIKDNKYNYILLDSFSHGKTVIEIAL